MEKWPAPMLGRLLPRHLEIIYESIGRFLRDVSIRFNARWRETASHVPDRGGAEKWVRMAHLDHRRLAFGPTGRVR